MFQGTTTGRLQAREKAAYAALGMCSIRYANVNRKVKPEVPPFCSSKEVSGFNLEIRPALVIALTCHSNSPHADSPDGEGPSQSPADRPKVSAEPGSRACPLHYVPGKAPLL